MDQVKEQQYEQTIKLICDFIEGKIGNGGKGKGAPPIQAAIKAQFNKIPAEDYDEVMNYVYTLFEQRRVEDGTIPIGEPTELPEQAKPNGPIVQDNPIIGGNQ